MLEKDRNLRYQHAADIRAELQRLKRDMESSRKVGTAEGVATIVEVAAMPSAAQSSSSAVLVAAKQHRWAASAGVLALLVVLTAAGFGVYSLWHRPASAPFQNFTVTQVTNTGKAARAAISPDGRYVLSVMDDNGMESLWLRNVPTGSDTQVIPPSASHYDTLAFSPDGNYIYFTKATSPTHSYYDFYRTPILGGTPQIVVGNIASNVAFSPNGQRIAYIRENDPEVGHPTQASTASQVGKGAGSEGQSCCESGGLLALFRMALIETPPGAQGRVCPLGVQLAFNWPDWDQGESNEPESPQVRRQH